jgi:hypothetical protein
VLYVNGNYTTIDNSTLAITGSGQNQSGMITYYVQPTSIWGSAGYVTVNWYWNPGGFGATESGSFGAFSYFNGTYDGVLFGNLPSGLTISMTPPRYSPATGPLQIDWNGVLLTYNPVASSASTSNTNGADVYQDTGGLGLTATVQSNGSVTLTAANGAAYSGTYSGGAFTFSGGQSPGTVTAIGSSGSSGNPPRGGTIGESSEVAGDLDIEGDFLTLGTWITGGSNSVNALGISYTDVSGSNPAVLRFAGTRGSLDWLWSEATADATNPQVSMMEVDPAHRLILHDTTTDNGAGVTLDPTGPSNFAGSVVVGSGTAPAIILPPAGPAHYKNAILIAPQGDIGMGAFTGGTVP